MERKVKKCLQDILDAVNLVEDFIGERKDFNKYKQNLMLKKAVEREFEIIGEALNRIKKIDKGFKITHSRNIIGLRNHIIHAYDNIVDEIIWGIINRNLPELKEEIKGLLED